MARAAVIRRFVALVMALLMFGSQTAAALPLVFCAHEDGTRSVEWEHSVAAEERSDAGATAQTGDLHPSDCEDAPVAVHPARVQSARLDAPKSIAVAAPAVPQAALALQLISPPAALRPRPEAAATHKPQPHIAWIRTVRLTV